MYIFHIVYTMIHVVTGNSNSENSIFNGRVEFFISLCSNISHVPEYNCIQYVDDMRVCYNVAPMELLYLDYYDRYYANDRF